jgi:hypothetical protein
VSPFAKDAISGQICPLERQAGSSDIRVVKETHTRITLESGSVFVCRYSPEYYLDQPISRGLIGLFLPHHGVAVAVDDIATVEPVTPVTGGEG